MEARRGGGTGASSGHGDGRDNGMATAMATATPTTDGGSCSYWGRAPGGPPRMQPHNSLLFLLCYHIVMLIFCYRSGGGRGSPCHEQVELALAGGPFQPHLYVAGAVQYCTARRRCVREPALRALAPRGLCIPNSWMD